MKYSVINKSSDFAYRAPDGSIPYSIDKAATVPLFNEFAELSAEDPVALANFYKKLWELGKEDQEKEPYWGLKEGQYWEIRKVKSLAAVTEEGDGFTFYLYETPESDQAVSAYLEYYGGEIGDEEGGYWEIYDIDDNAIGWDTEGLSQEVKDIIYPILEELQQIYNSSNE